LPLSFLLLRCPRSRALPALHSFPTRRSSDLSHWQKGRLQLSGHWQDKQLTLDNVLLSHLNYSLPSLTALSWPAALSQLTIKEMLITPSYLASTDEQFPWQIIAFELTGHNLHLTPHHPLWLTEGQLQFSAPAAALNGEAFKRLTGHLQIVEQQMVGQVNALTPQGIVEFNTNLKATIPATIKLAFN